MTSAYLQCRDTQEMYELGDFNVISNKFHHVKDVKSIVLKNCQHKHCAIVKFNEEFKIMDLCSFQTKLRMSTNSNSFQDLPPLKFFNLKDGDEIIIGSFNFIINILPPKVERVIVPGSPEREESQQVDEEVTAKMEVEVLPETQSLNFSQNTLINEILTNVNFDCSETVDDESDDERLQPLKKEEIKCEIVNEKENLQTNKINFVPTQGFIFGVETQPIFNLPRNTRAYKRKQEQIKPRTIPVHLLETTQDILAGFEKETQSVIMPKPKKIKVERDLEFDEKFTSQSQNRVNPLLLSDDEENEQDDDIFGSFLQKKISVKNEIDEFSSTQDGFNVSIPDVPSQFLENSVLMQQINESQQKTDNSILDFNIIESQPEIKPEPVRKFFGKDSKTERRKKKFLKYGSSDDEEY